MQSVYAPMAIAETPDTMQKMIDTVIGDGNRFHDVSFLWLSKQDDQLLNISEQTMRRMGSSLGFTHEAFVDVSVGEQQLRHIFADTLTARPPKPTTADRIGLIVELAKTLDEFSARRRFVVEFTRWASEGRLGELTEWQQREDSDLKRFDVQSLRRHIDAAFDEPTIIVERSPPSAETVMSLLSKGSGVAIGAYLGFLTAGDSPLYLYAAVPGGMILCCTAAGIAEALQLGLRERIFQWLTRSTRAPERHAPLREAPLLRDILPTRTEVDPARRDGSEPPKGVER
jgi:hypothetical protein